MKTNRIEVARFLLAALVLVDCRDRIAVTP
jgi:hypothetical protein